ncbi:alpha/beta hydrolase [Butyrivibrio sp. JL13D10]|uniref:alpha/beta hydrolase n=1 Tax=Butyrivibrio sp. JL13D10 TaxID=3236815 RepID=UPI0038B5797D
MIIVVPIILIILYLFVCAILARSMGLVKCIDPSIAYQKENRRHFLDGYKNWKKEEYIIKSFDGYELHATYIPSAIPSKKYVILVHSSTYCRIGGIKYFNIFQKMGYNGILFDLRGHGDNKKSPSTWGIKESKDLLSVINDTVNRFGNDIKIGVHGECLGGVTALTALKYNPHISFVIADSCYNSLYSLLCKLAQQVAHVSPVLFDPAEIFFKLMFGFSYKNIFTKDSLRGNKIPVCFIQGDSDCVVPVNDTMELESATKGYTEMHIFEGADHTRNILVDAERYEAIIKHFLYSVKCLELAA